MAGDEDKHCGQISHAPVEALALGNSGGNQDLVWYVYAFIVDGGVKWTWIFPQFPC